MINATVYDANFWDILTRGRLVDLSQFHKPDAFEEVPLFTRYSELDFLNGKTSSEINSILLRFALKFLKTIILYEEHRTHYLAAITIWEPLDSDDPIVPNLFFWSGKADRVKNLKKQLPLDRVSTPFGRKIKQLAGAGAHPRFDVLEDHSTIPGESRIFVSLGQRPYPSFLTLKDLQRPANSLTLKNLQGPAKPGTSSAKPLTWTTADFTQGIRASSKKRRVKK
ncbi:MAG: hypothetical protein ABS79_07815 [Planctomycetes bacterium SCN 63-9]|nr:MAG: hypothetical protein ABS79_07815 [Planctomycetes bacterium SCN 63-9]